MKVWKIVLLVVAALLLGWGISFAINGGGLKLDIGRRGKKNGNGNGNGAQNGENQLAA